MKRIALIALAALSLGACARESGWNPPPGGTRQAFEGDAYKCRRDALAGGDMVGVSGVYTRTEDWNLYRICMRSKGYTVDGRPGVGWFPSW